MRPLSLEATPKVEPLRHKLYYHPAKSFEIRSAKANSRQLVFDRAALVALSLGGPAAKRVGEIGGITRHMDPAVFGRRALLPPHHTRLESRGRDGDDRICDCLPRCPAHKVGKSVHAAGGGSLANAFGCQKWLAPVA